MRLQSPVLTLVTLALVACQDTLKVSPARPAASISDAAHSAGNPHFYFLPPLVPQPTFTGTFDATYLPVVRVCEWDGVKCALLLAEFTATSGPGSETVRVDPSSELYTVNWNTGDYALDPAKTYRIRILLGKTELGYSDVDVVAGAKELRNVQTGEYIGLLDGRTLPIKFRVEMRALCGSDPSCGEARIGSGGGSMLATNGLAGVAIPSGALDHDIHVALHLRDPQPCFPTTVLVAGGCYEVVTDQAPGFTMQAPATVGICADDGEPNASLQLAKLEPDDPAQSVVLLDGATADFLQCGSAEPAGGLASSFSYVAPTVPGAWSSQPSVPRVEAVATALILPQQPPWWDDRNASSVLVTGGFQVSSGSIVPSGFAEVVTIPTSSTGAPPRSTPVGSLVTPRWGHTATRLIDGRVLIVGGLGTDPTCAITDAEIYNPATHTFTGTGSLNVARARATATRLLDGRVLIVGGLTGCSILPPALASAEIYDPSTGQFTLTGSLNHPRERHTATLLPDGRVLIAGGDAGANPDDTCIPSCALPPVLQSTELFTPNSGAFQPGANLRVPRYRHTATFLPMSTARAGVAVVLIAGGTTGAQVQSTAEVVCVPVINNATCSQVLPLARGVFDHQARLTGGENVLLVGGVADLQETQVATTQWIRDQYPLQAFQPPSMATARDGHTAMHIYANRVLVVGGFSGSVLATTREVFTFCTSSLSGGC